MSGISGLQFEARCVKCGSLPSTQIMLLEMKNHLYICHKCRQQEEARGKHIEWVNNQQRAALPQSAQVGGAAPSGPLARVSTKTRTLTTSAPDSIFAVLELSSQASIAEIKEALRKKMRTVMRDPDQKELNNRLRQWQEKLEDEEAFEASLASQRSAQRERGTFSVGGQIVTTAQEFLAACEGSAQSWADGEHYLRSGQLRQWILFQLDDRELAVQARHYQSWSAVSDFRALNAILYCLVPQRPLRFYKEEKWQPLEQAPSATTPKALADLCDEHWSLGERHLYEGCIVFWLEISHGIKGVDNYYKRCVAGYADKGVERGVGLELLLEYALPDLAKPHLEVTFNGQIGACRIERWDREIPHRPVVMKIANTTRGHVSFQTSLQQRRAVTEPDWIALNTNSAQSFSDRREVGQPIQKSLTLMHLEKLNRGQKYQRTLTLALRGEYGAPPRVQDYPITLKTMYFFQGLRGQLWRWGLRGGLPGLFWNFVTGIALAFLAFRVVVLVPLGHYLFWAPASVGTISFGDVMNATLAGLAGMIADSGNSSFLAVGAMLGLVGLCVGSGKGHANYQPGQNAKSFRKGSFWLILLAVIALLTLNHGWETIGYALSSGSRNPDLVQWGLYYGLGGLMVGILVFIIACITASIHTRLERFLRRRYRHLLHPEGSA
ncbi:MAG TPA: hypothetical protein VKR06_19605 [Ktedonosporobacter sp.]|nr:hypothetical protein [Ktedonosporobacter sp.]